MATIVVFGETGQVARGLANLGRGSLDLRFFGRSRIDPRRSQDVSTIIETERPDLVLNAAAYTQVDLAEKESELAFALNAELPRQMAIACSRKRVAFVHISTDYVFDGTKVGAYLESDATNPLGVYGASKLAGDKAIMEAAVSPFAILRTSWAFSHIGETFPRKILRRARAQASLSVVDDQRGCPTPADDLAGAMIEMGRRLMDGDQSAQGLFNYCGDTAMSWFDFACRLVESAQAHGLGACPIVPMASSALQLPAKRPANSVLDCELLRVRCGIAPAQVAPAIARTVAELMKE